MAVIDSQVHAYEPNHAGRPWATVPDWPAQATGDDMVAAMDAVGVDGALLVSAFSMYRYDPSYAIEVRARHPYRFAMITPVDPSDPAVDEQIQDWAALEGAVAIRLVLRDEVSEDPNDPGIARVLDTAARLSLPVNLLSWDRPAQGRALAAAYPETRLIIDHLGIKQPYHPPVPPEPFAELPGVLEMAAFDNVAIKVSGTCTLSRRGFPYDDIWEPLARVFEAFGLERCMWGTDWTRALAMLTYEQGVAPFRATDRLSDEERAMLMGGALARVYDWGPTGRAAAG